MSKPTKPGWYAILHEDRGDTMALVFKDPVHGLRMLIPGDARPADPSQWSGQFIGPLDLRSLTDANACLARVRGVLARWVEYAEREGAPESLRRVNRDFAIELKAALGPTQPIGNLVPWWKLRMTLKDGPRAGRYLGNTTEFRAVLRGLLSGSPLGAESMTAGYLNSSYVLDEASEKALSEGRVDWRWFPMHESVLHRWRPHPDMRAAMQADKDAGQLPKPQKKNLCEHGGDHPAPAGQRFCSNACERCEGTDFDASTAGCAGICENQPTKESQDP